MFALMPALRTLFKRFVIALVLFTAGYAMGIEPSKADESLTLKIVDRFGLPVGCEIQRISPTGTIEMVGHTDPENPIVTIPDGCKSGCRLVFIPDAGSVYYRDSKYCPYKKESYMVRPIVGDEARRLAASLDAAKGIDGNAAKIALISNEIADRTSKRTVKEAYEVQTYVEAGKFLKVESPVEYDPQQKKTVPSTELEAKVRKFQEDQGLNPTGSLNYPTLRKASGSTTEDLLRSATPASVNRPQ